jgi:WD40 repeat protein
LLTGSQDNTLKTWDGTNGQLLQTFQGHTGTVYGAAFIGEELIVSISHDKTIAVWNSRTAQRLKSIQTQSKIYGVAVSTDGQLLVTGSGDGCVRRYEGAANPIGMIC